MINYKILESTVAHFKNIEIPFDFSNFKVGERLMFLGYDLNITQLGTGIVCLSNVDYAFTLQAMEIPAQETTTID